MLVGIYDVSAYNTDPRHNTETRNLLRVTDLVRNEIDADKPHDFSQCSLIAKWKKYLAQLSQFPDVNAGYILTRDRLIGQFDENSVVEVRASLCLSGT